MNFLRVSTTPWQLPPCLSILCVIKLLSSLGLFAMANLSSLPVPSSSLLVPLIRSYERSNMHVIHCCFLEGVRGRKKQTKKHYHRMRYYLHWWTGRKIIFGYYLFSDNACSVEFLTELAFMALIKITYHSVFITKQASRQADGQTYGHHRERIYFTVEKLPIWLLASYYVQVHSYGSTT